MWTPDRKTLYDLVWSTPLNKIAAEHGTSYGELVKACDLLKVPRPPHDHWTKVGLGHPVVVPPLPEVGPGVPTAASPKLRVPRPVSSVSRVVVKLPPIPDHELIQASRAALKGAERDQYGWVVPHRHRRCLAVRVSPDQVERALGVYALILGSILGTSAKLEVRRRNEFSRYETWITWDSEEMQLELRETTHCAIRPATPEERRRLFLPSGVVREYVPTGKLKLAITTLARTGARQSWADSTTGSVEEKLDGFRYALQAGADALKKQREEHAKAQAEWAERARRAEAARKEAERQQALVSQALRMAQRWRAANDVRTFIQAVLAVLPKDERDEPLEEWYSLLRHYADLLDPLVDPEEARTLLLKPDRSTWFSDEDLGNLHSAGSGRYGPHW